MDKMLLNLKTGVNAQLTKEKEKVKPHVKSWHNVSLEAMTLTYPAQIFYTKVQKQFLSTNGVFN